MSYAAFRTYMKRTEPEPYTMNADQKMMSAGVQQPTWRPKIFPKPDIKRVDLVAKKSSISHTQVLPSSVAPKKS
jgi:hypothetical protein